MEAPNGFPYFEFDMLEYDEGKELYFKRKATLFYVDEWIRLWRSTEVSGEKVVYFRTSDGWEYIAVDSYKKITERIKQWNNYLELVYQSRSASE